MLSRPSALGTTAIEAIVIGASAGGVSALSALLGLLPSSWSIPVVVAMHLLPGRQSLLPAVFKERCRVPVAEPVDKQPVTGGKVWVAPADYHLLIEPERVFSVSVEGPVNFSRPSIDVLFESAALAYRSELLGIVLTGANEDGTAGARVIQREGGKIFVQDPADAESPRMPSSVLETMSADFVGSVNELGAQLLAIMERK